MLKRLNSCFFHSYQRMIANEDIPDSMINDEKIERVSRFNFLT